MPHFDFPNGPTSPEVLLDSRGRFYKVAFQNHDSTIMGMYAVPDESKNSMEILSVDSNGGLKVLNVDKLSSESLELFEGDPVEVTAVTLNQSTKVIYMGMKTGAIWSCDMESSEEKGYTHDGQVTAIASFKSVIISAGLDNIIKMYHMPTDRVVATVQCSNEIVHLHMLPSISGGPVAIVDIGGNLSVWSAHLLGNAGVTDSVQYVCNLNSLPIALDEIKLFDRSCLLCVTGGWIRIWAISIINDDGHEVVSILRDAIYSLVRSISAPQGVEFTSCCNTSTQVTSTLLTGCSNGSVYQWDALTGSRLRKYDISPHPNTFLVHLPSRHMFAACDSSNDLNLIDPYSSSLVDHTSAIKGITCGALCDFRGVVTVVGADGVLHLRTDRKESASPPKIGAGDVTAVSIVALESSDSIVVIAGHKSGLITTFVGDAEKELIFGNFVSVDTNVYSSPVTIVRHFGNKDQVATCSETECIFIWKASDNGLSKLTQIPHTAFTTCITYSPAGVLGIGTELGVLTLYSCKTWKVVATRAKTHQDDAIRSVGVMYDASKKCRFLTSVGKRCQCVKFWKQHGRDMIFENRIDLPAECVDVRFWEKGEGSLLFIQSKLNFSYCLDMNDAARGVVRFFSTNGSKLLAVSGNSSPVVLTLGEPHDKYGGQVVNIWNNDLHDEQVCHNNMLDEFDAYRSAPNSYMTSLYSSLRSHPSFPGCLLVPDPHYGDQTLFAQAITGGHSDFVVEFLPHVPMAVLLKCQFRRHNRSLLWLALKMKDAVSIDLILRVWTDILCAAPISIESSAWHVSELFEDLKVLSYEHPAKFSEFIRQLDIPMGHSINCKEGDSKDIGADEVWMRGSGLRVVPSFWKSVETPFPDLQDRTFEPDKECGVTDVETPHQNAAMLEPCTRKCEPRPRKSHPSVNAGSGTREESTHLGSDDWDWDGLGNRHTIARQNLSRGGSIVQSYIHPVPYAAFGTEFLHMCQMCCSSSGRSSLMACPAVATVIDYKWNTFFGDLHVASALHYLYVLIIYSVVTVYFDPLVDSPSKTGLPILAWVGAIFVAVSYLLLFLQELLRLDDEWPVAYRDAWFWIGLVAYYLAISGILMTLCEGETTFNSRCVLSIGTLFLFLKFIYFLLPFSECGQLAHRFLLTVRAIKYNIMMVILGLCAFSVSFNHMHNRQANASTYDSLYGSFIQTISYALGGFTTEFPDEADNALFMSFVFVVFVFVILLVLVVILIASAVDAYQRTAKEARSLWRVSQSRIILKKASLFSVQEASQSYHNPKWLHLLAPAGKVRAFEATSAGEGDEPACSCSFGSQFTSNGTGVNTAAVDKKAIMDEIALLKGLVLQMQDRIDSLNSSKTNGHEIAGQIADILRHEWKASQPGPLKKVSPRENVQAPPLEPRKVEKSPREETRKVVARVPIEPEPDLPVEDKHPLIVKRVHQVPPPESSPKGKPKGSATSTIRVRQIPASKKRLSRQIRSQSDDESSPSNSPIKLVH